MISKFDAYFSDRSGNPLEGSTLGRRVCEELSEIASDVRNIVEVLDLLVEHACGFDRTTRRGGVSHLLIYFILLF